MGPHPARRDDSPVDVQAIGNCFQGFSFFWASKTVEQVGPDLWDIHLDGFYVQPGGDFGPMIVQVLLWDAWDRRSQFCWTIPYVPE